MVEARVEAAFLDHWRLLDLVGHDQLHIGVHRHHAVRISVEVAVDDCHLELAAKSWRFEVLSGLRVGGGASHLR